MRNLVTIALAAVLLCVVLTACANEPPPVEDTPPPTSTALAISETPASTPTESAEPTPSLVPEREIELVAKTLRGECYDDQPDDKREVVRVICNRVADGRFGDSVEAVITAPRQFAGYRPGNEPTANDTAIAREVLTAWYAGGCGPMSEYLYFSSGGGRKNVFRKNY